MCCTFGDTVDVEWWYTHELPLREAIGTAAAVSPPSRTISREGMVEEVRHATVEALEAAGDLPAARQSSKRCASTSGATLPWNTS